MWRGKESRGEIIMAGEHILKLLIEENARVEIGDRWLVVPVNPGGIEYTVYQHKSYAKRTRVCKH